MLFLDGETGLSVLKVHGKIKLLYWVSVWFRKSRSLL
jgi:hypothetical protein